MSERQEVCRVCVWWSRHAPRTESGDCRRRPPVVFGRPKGGFDSDWPQTLKDEWCGEFAWDREEADA